MFNKLLLLACCMIGFNVFYSFSSEKVYKLWYKRPACNLGGEFRLNESDRPVDEEWENSSLPIGNGYMGVSVFGGTDTERLQITDKTLHIKGLWGAETHTSFADIYLDFFHNNRSCYERSLSLNDAVCRVKYKYDNVNYSREYFASYPDKVMAMKLVSDKPGKLSLNIRAKIPYLVPFGKMLRKDSMTIGYLSGATQTRFDNNGRTGYVTVSGGKMTLRGETEYLGMKYEGQLKVINFGGNITSFNDDKGVNSFIRIENADSLVILFALGTNYRLTENVFSGPHSERLKGNPDPHAQIVDIIEKATSLGYESLKNRHIRDYTSFFNRVKIDFGQTIPQVPTDELLENYRKGYKNTYLEELLFQYGRYLLISTSRKGTLPPTLQGVWNQYELAPWNDNYTHNINIQMNYWPVFSTNLSELFESYVDYYKAYRKKAEFIATQYIRRNNPVVSGKKTGDDGWIVGAGAGPFFIGSPGGHSGPGTGGLTGKLFWDYYEFTSDKKVLEEVTYPALKGLSLFFSKTLRDTLGCVLAYPSSSPEQFSKITGKPYSSLGCAFDQQMIYETYNDFIKASDILGRSSALLKRIKWQMKYMEPVLIGADGQVKEYREENHYDDIVLEKNHRHISNLVGLYPGTIINPSEPEWINAAKVTLELRGDKSTGWSMAHKTSLWARTKDGNRAHKVLDTLISTAVFDNLWTNCIAVLRNPYQIDANFGTTAAVAEMLLQSHNGYIDLLPALPDCWREGSYEGLVARGNFEVSLSWNDSVIKDMKIHSRAGNKCVLHYPDISQCRILSSDGNEVRFKTISKDRICFSTCTGEEYHVVL